MQTNSFCPSCHYHSEDEIGKGNEDCPKCGCVLTNEIPAWRKNLDSAQGKQTGPKNTKRSSANAMKHGLYSKIHRWFPAKKDKYSECEGCPYHEKCNVDEWCWLRNKIYNEMQIAFESGDTEAIRKYIAQDQTKLIFIRTMVMNEILKRGGMFPTFMQDSMGQLVYDKKEKPVINGYSPNPLLGYVDKLINVGNAKMEDYLMTPKTRESKGETDPDKGRLTSEEFLELLGGFKEAMKKDDQE